MFITLCNVNVQKWLFRNQPILYKTRVLVNKYKIMDMEFHLSNVINTRVLILELTEKVK